MEIITQCIVQSRHLRSEHPIKLDLFPSHKRQPNNQIRHPNCVSGASSLWHTTPIPNRCNILGQDHLLRIPANYEYFYQSRLIIIRLLNLQIALFDVDVDDDEDFNAKQTRNTRSRHSISIKGVHKVIVVRLTGARS